MGRWGADRRRRGLRAGIVAAVAAAALAATAWADQAPDGTTRLDPPVAGAQARFLLDARGPEAGLVDGKVPEGLSFEFQKGFEFHADAVAQTCTLAQARKQQCPEGSRMGSGQIDLLAKGLGFSRGGDRFVAALSFFRAAPPSPDDITGVIFTFREQESGFSGASLGRLTAEDDPVYGTALRIDELPLPSLPPGMSFTLTRLRVELGAAGAPPVKKPKPKPKRRACPAPKKKKRSGARKSAAAHQSATSKSKAKAKSKRCAPARKKKPAKKPAAKRSARAAATGADGLITNPPACLGSWAVRYSIRYSGGVQERDAPAPCTAG